MLECPTPGVRPWTSDPGMLHIIIKAGQSAFVDSHIIMIAKTGWPVSDVLQGYEYAPICKQALPIGLYFSSTILLYDYHINSI